MFRPKFTRLRNNLAVITVNLAHLDSVTTLIAVGAGSRYEDQKTNGISHFLEHMFFKGSKKYPSAEQIATIVDGMGAINNAWTSQEVTTYWIKSSAAHLKESSDILSSMVKESLLLEGEVEREKGVITEEIRMVKDDPARYVWHLFQQMFFTSHPLHWDVLGEESTINNFKRGDFAEYMQMLYHPRNMVLVYVGKLPESILELAGGYFGDLLDKKTLRVNKSRLSGQKSPRVGVYYKNTDQASVMLGVEGFARSNSNRYAARVLSAFLGEGMSSRLFLQVRERRGLAYYVRSEHEPFLDTGLFAASAGLKLEKLDEGIKVIKDELLRLTVERVREEELIKAKEIIRGRLALRSESSNFLAESFAVEQVLDGHIETFEQYLAKIDQVSSEDIFRVAKEMFVPSKFNLQIIAPLKNPAKFEAILKS